MAGQELAEALALHLDAEGVGTYATSTPFGPGDLPLSIGGFPPGHGPAVMLTPYPGGPEPDSRNGWEYPRLQVRVRHQDPLEAQRLDRTAYEVLQAAAGTYPVGLPGGVWLLQDCYALQSEAEPLGRDDAGLWHYARNYQLTTELV